MGRYNVDGSLDASFDGDGKVKLNFGVGDQALAVEVDAAGKVVLAGGTNDAPPLGDLLVVRLNANGSLDATFDADGSRVIDLGDKTLGLGLALDRTGRVVVGGISSIGTDVRALLIRLTASGAYDTSFSADGIVREDFGGSDEFNHLAVDDRGRIVAAGNGGTNGAGAGTGTDAIVARYTEAGALDTTFGASGKRYVHFGGASDDAEDMALDPFGRAVLVGDDGGVDFAVARLTVDGALDTTFDGDGLAKVNFVTGNTESGQAIAIQTDGRIVVVGRSGNDFAVARLSGGGTRSYAVQDANFNTTAVTDATGKVLDRYQYDPYGTVKVLNADFTPDADNTQDVNQPYLWQGGALVTATGTYHFRNRDVSPSLGRATSADPLGYPDGMSRYEWDGSNPIVFVDPLGLANTKIDGERYYVHPNDKDPFPSDPHAHKGGPNSRCKVHVGTGELFDGGKATGKFLPAKTLAKLRGWMRGNGLLPICIGAMLALPEVAEAASTDGVDGVAGVGGGLVADAAAAAAASVGVGGAVMSTAGAMGTSVTVGGTLGTGIGGAAAAGVGGAMVVGGAAIAAAAAGAAAGTAIANTEVGGDTVAGLIGNGMYTTCPWCFNW